MTGELGQFILIATACCALIFSFPILIGERRGNSFFAGLWKPSISLVFAGLSLSVGILVYAFLTNDFSIAYVTNNSNTHLHWAYKISALWAGHEGSMLLWAWSIMAWTVLFFVFSNDDTEFKSRTAAVILFVAGLICLFIVFTSNPFARLLPFYPGEGKDLNPILQDIGMILHPPALFIGYAGCALCFAIGLAAAMGKRTGGSSLTSLTNVTIFSWLFLTAGNVLGSWWAYNELGWGGWWFWDPVENSSFVPWLFLSAQLHALVLSKYNKKLTNTALFLSLISFAVCLLGTFIVRSGIIQSVHAFASAPGRGLALLIVSLVILIPAFVIFGKSASESGSSSSIENKSVAEIMTILAVLLLCVSAISILFGTLYPLIHETFGGETLSVGAPYFNSIFAPMVILAALLIAGFQLRNNNVFVNLSILVFSGALAAYFGFFTSAKSAVYTFTGVFSAVLLTLSFVTSLLKKQKNLFALVAHLGIAISILGVVGDSQFSNEAVVRMGPGQGRQVGDLIFVYDRTVKVDTPSYWADEGDILVLDEAENVIGHLNPQRQTFKNNGMEMTAAGISHGFFRDLYISMGNRLSQEEYLVRINVRPLVSWIWFGGVLMILSVLFAFTRRKTLSASKG